MAGVSPKPLVVTVTFDLHLMRIKTHLMRIRRIRKFLDLKMLQARLSGEIPEFLCLKQSLVLDIILMNLRQSHLLWVLGLLNCNSGTV